MPNPFAVAAVYAAIAVHAGIAAAAPAFTVKKDIAYLETANGPTLDMYIPAGADDKHRVPGFVWIHGGGWSSGAKDGGREVAVCTALATAGFLTVSIDYDLSTAAKPAWPANIAQCKAAIRFLLHMGTAYGVDTANIAVGGGSAGAHLAVLAGLTGDKLFPTTSHAGYSGKVKAILDMYGPVSTYDWYGSSVKQLLGVASAKDPLIAQSSAETYLSAQSPPVFVTHGLMDTTVDAVSSRNFADRLAKAGFDYKLVLIPEAGHSYDLDKYNGKPLSVDLKGMVIAWLRDKLRSSTAAMPGLGRPGTGGSGAEETRPVRINGATVNVPAAWFLATQSEGAGNGEVTAELRDRNGRMVSAGRLSLTELLAPDRREASRTEAGAGVYFLTLRCGNRTVNAAVARLR